MKSIRRSPLSLLGVALTLGLGLDMASPSQAFALPVGTERDIHESLREAPTWEELEAAAVDFTAIVALSNCSGSLVKFTTSKTTDRAMVLTNGHCVSGMVAAGTATVGLSVSRSFSLLNSTGRSTLGTLKSDQLLYATMTGTDIGLYRLTQTYAQIATKYKVAPLTISDQHPIVGAPVRIVSGYWKKIYSCSIAKFVHELHEATWSFQDSIRFSEPGCETIGGTSGSPIVHADTHEVIGINNTGNEDGEKCTLDNPCEIDETGTVTYEKGAAYGQELHQIYSCLNSANAIDLSIAGCQLQKPATH